MYFLQTSIKIWKIQLSIEWLFLFIEHFKCNVFPLLEFLLLRAFVLLEDFVSSFQLVVSGSQLKQDCFYENNLITFSGRKGATSNITLDNSLCFLLNSWDGLTWASKCVRGKNCIWGSGIKVRDLIGSFLY